MNKFAAAAVGVALSLTAAVPAASAQSLSGAVATRVAANTADENLRGGYDDRDDRDYRGDRDGRGRADPGFNNGGWARPDAVGRTSAFFIEPRLNGQRVMVDYRRGNQRFAEEQATDNFCRRVGYREGAYYSIDRSRRGAALEDVVCIR